MNRILLAAVAALIASSISLFVHAQVSGTISPQAQNVVMPREVAAPTLVQTTPRAATDADARACLDLPTNAEIIRCAEKYLPRKRGG
jgi:hypothetical protein